MRRAGVLGAVLALALGGCVTEHSGVPEPASKEDRIQAQINLARVIQFALKLNF